MAKSPQPGHHTITPKPIAPPPPLSQFVYPTHKPDQGSVRGIPSAMTPEDTTIPGAGNDGTGDGSTAGVFSGFDYSQLLQLGGLPSDVAAKINQIFRQTSDVNQAILLALAYVRGTPWYAQTFPGIQAGIQKGLISDERGYRAYMNDLNQVYRNYTGRDVAAGEVAAALSEGVTPDIVGKRFAGQAYVNANGNDIQYLAGALSDTGRLNDQQLTAYGREQAGIDSQLGQSVQRALQRAQDTYSRLFSSEGATPSLSLSSGRLAAPSLNPTGAPDIGA